MTDVKIIHGVRVVNIYPEFDNICELCGKEDELRPYGPKGEDICYDCGMKDEKMTTKRMNQILFGKKLDS